MKILIIGKSGVGKSNLADIIKNTIFKMDSNSTITNDDPDRSIKTLGNGENKHNIYIKQLITDDNMVIPSEERDKYDVIIVLNGDGFSNWFNKIN